MSINEEQERIVSKKWFDMEYMTQWRREVEFLHENGIDPVYIKRNRYGIKIYKYIKDVKLFSTLLSFFTQIHNERTWNEMEKIFTAAGDPQCRQ